MSAGQHYRIPPDMGVVGHPETHAVIVYRLVPVWEPREEAYMGGGTMKRHVKTDRQTYEATELGRRNLVQLTPALCAEIEADLNRRRIML